MDCEEGVRHIINLMVPFVLPNTVPKISTLIVEIRLWRSVSESVPFLHFSLMEVIIMEFDRYIHITKYILQNKRSIDLNIFIFLTYYYYIITLNCNICSS